MKRRTTGRLGLGVRLTTLAACLSLGVTGLSEVADGLPAGRHYEMISPLYKGGYGVSRLGGLAAAAPDGDRVVFDSLGTFAGAQSGETTEGRGKAYLAFREESSWLTAPLTVPATTSPETGVLDYSSTLESYLSQGQAGPNTGVARFEEPVEYLLRQTFGRPEGFQVAGETSLSTDAHYLGTSADLSHIVFESDTALTPEAPASLAGGAGTNFGIKYDLISHGNAQQQRVLRMVGLNNMGEAINMTHNVDIGSGSGKFSQYGAVAADGEDIFFSTHSGSLYVRLAGARTLELSRPLDAAEPFGGCGDGGHLTEVPGEVPCPDSARGEFAGASEDGSIVFFTSPDRLISEDNDTEVDLYMAKIACSDAQPGCEMAEREVKELVLVSRDTSAAEAAGVQGVVAVSADGSHVYFVAHGVLSGENRQGHSPLAGADNLYVYDRQGGIAFVAELCSKPGASGEREDQQCRPNPSVYASDEGQWVSPGPEAQLADNGRFLVFTSYGQLTRDDTDNARDVYRYDAQDESLVRVSVGEAGSDANGNRADTGQEDADAGIRELGLGEAAHASVQAELERRAVSEDGSRIVFTTGEALSPQATNGSVNAYEWHNGSVSLVSSGSDENGVEEVVITPGGGDIFFATLAKLLPQDSDELKDIYDARSGLGFPAPAAEVQACAGDGCQGPLTNPAPLLVPGSVTQQSGENAAPPAGRSVVRRKLTCRRGYRHGRRGKCVKAKRRTHKASSKQRRRSMVRQGRRS